MRFAFFGSSITSAYWNGAATYYRGIVKNLHARGHAVTFYEPDAFERQRHRDIPDPPYCDVVVYDNDEAACRRTLEGAADADFFVKCSGVGVFDTLLERELPTEAGRRGRRSIFWDVDAPATLERCHDHADPFHGDVGRYDLILTYGGGDRVVKGYANLGAKRCVPIYNALDPDTHHPVTGDPKHAADLNLLANNLPDRRARIETFFLDAARACPDRTFKLGGSGWDGDGGLPANVEAIGHVGTDEHNSFNCAPLAVLNVNRESMARFGYSPATRVFEAAGAGACLITDKWDGIDSFLEPDAEVLIASDGHEVAEHLKGLTPDRAKQVGDAARRRVLAEHTYAQRAEQVETLLEAYL